MSSDLNATDVAISEVSELERQLELDIENIVKTLESKKLELSSVQATKKMLWGRRSNTPISGSQQLKPASSELVEDRGRPENWLFPQYKLVGSTKAIEQILKERKEPIEIEDLVKELYDTRSEDEFKRARNSLSAGLRRGAEEGAWKKFGRSYYAANSVDSTNSVVDRSDTADIGLKQNDELEQEQPTPENYTQELAV